MQWDEVQTKKCRTAQRAVQPLNGRSQQMNAAGRAACQLQRVDDTDAPPTRSMRVAICRLTVTR
jgi:hypothetical protein